MITNAKTNRHIAARYMCMASNHQGLYIIEKNLWDFYNADK